MSAGTDIIQEALERIGAHSVVSPANPESIETGRNVLNGMIATWYDAKSIDMGAVPLSAAGSELSEPLGARNAIIDNLAILLHPLFPATQVSADLRTNAAKGYSDVVKTWKVINIPKQKVRGTLPKGQGNKHTYTGTFDQAYFDKGEEIG